MGAKYFISHSRPGRHLFTRTNRGTTSFNYQQRRAWGEDLCEMLIQPIYHDNKLGPVLHIVCKPNGGVSLERKTDTRPSDGGWKPLDSIRRPLFRQNAGYGIDLDRRNRHPVEYDHEPGRRPANSAPFQLFPA